LEKRTGPQGGEHGKIKHTRAKKKSGSWGKGVAQKEKKRGSERPGQKPRKAPCSWGKL